jgi:HEPN domain-containing protein
MKNPRVNALRWLRQAEADLKQAARLLEEEVFSYSCFFAEQSSQKSCKAVLLFDGARVIAIHSVAELLRRLSEKRAEFQDLQREGAILDQYYLTSRYPDAVAEPAIPSEIFTKRQAEEAVRTAQAIFDKASAVVR